MNRRLFLKHSVITSLGLTCSPLRTALAAGSIPLTILHTNDTHSRIDPFPAGSKYQGLGGASRRAALVRKIRNEEKNVLLLDAGDTFQGTPYFNFFGGEVEFRTMSEMKYDASTIGNHDFDAGLDGLDKVLPHATFDFIISNYDFSQTALNGKTVPFRIFKIGGVKVGVFGLGIQLENLVSSTNYGKTKYLDPVPIAREMIGELRNKKCQLIICLSHLGYKYDSDRISDTALTKEVSGIDLIIGGHTHTFLDEPVVVMNGEGHQTIINQVGFAGIRLGRIDFSFTRTNKNVSGFDSLVINDF